MSQVLPPAPGERDDPGPPLESRQQMLDWFAKGEKPRSRFAIGTEHEKFGFLRETRSPLPWEGERGIEALLEAIASDEQDIQNHGPWTRIEEDGHLIGLTRKGASVSLEPGGQLELSGAPLKNLQETCQETGAHLELLKRVCLPRGIGFLGMGFHPTAKWEEFPVLPKGRYGIMNRYMPTVGSRGLDMMKRTCTVQANFDFETEADMVATVQTALKVSPIVVALFANSPFIEGRVTGKCSERAWVWTDTDPHRSGYVQAFLEDDFGYERYLDYVLDVPMYFIRRDGVHHDYAGASFRAFWKEGLDGHQATLRDFEDHLTTAFPEVRVKRFIEVRSADCGPWSRICALPAFWKGLLYDHTSRDAASQLIGKVDASELTTLHQDCAKRGYEAEFRGRTAGELGLELCNLARDGLTRLADDPDLGGHGHVETGFLDPLYEDLDRGHCFADRLIDLYENDWGGSIDPLWDHLEFFEDRRKAKR